MDAFLNKVKEHKIENPFLDLYIDLVGSISKKRPRNKGCGFCRHHILPISLGGMRDLKADPSNIVPLTHAEHLRSHFLLWKGLRGTTLDPKNSMAYALHLMTTQRLELITLENIGFIEDDYTVFQEELRQARKSRRHTSEEIAKRTKSLEATKDLRAENLRGRKPLWKNGARKMARPSSPEWHRLLEEGFVPQEGHVSTGVKRSAEFKARRSELSLGNKFAEGTIKLSKEGFPDVWTKRDSMEFGILLADGYVLPKKTARNKEYARRNQKSPKCKLTDEEFASFVKEKNTIKLMKPGEVRALPILGSVYWMELLERGYQPSPFFYRRYATTVEALLTGTVHFAEKPPVDRRNLRRLVRGAHKTNVDPSSPKFAQLLAEGYQTVESFEAEKKKNQKTLFRLFLGDEVRRVEFESPAWVEAVALGFWMTPRLAKRFKLNRADYSIVG